MSIEELGALGEFLGLFAIIATLIYLSLQVRLTREDSGKAALEARSAAWRDMVMQTVSDNDLTETLLKAQAAYQEEPSTFERELMELGLVHAEANKVFRWMYAQWRMNQVWFQTHSPDQRDDLDATLLATYSSGLGRGFWNHFGGRFGGRGKTAFAAHVDGLIQD